MSLLPGVGDLSERARWHLGGLLTIKVAAADSDGAISVVEERALRGYATPPHVHGREDETLYVIEGEVEYVVDGRPGVVTSGEGVFLPRGLAHNFRVASAEAHFLVIITPGGFEEFFQQVSPPALAERPPGEQDHPHTDPALVVTAAGVLGTTVFRGSEAVVVAAATAVTTSTDPVELARAYRVVENAVAGPVPAPLDTVADLLLQAARRVAQNPLHARALLLLGILAEGEDPARQRVHDAAPELVRLVRPGAPPAVALASTYLLAHFPEHGQAVREALEPLGLNESDWLRLLRCLDARVGRRGAVGVRDDGAAGVHGCQGRERRDGERPCLICSTRGSTTPSRARPATVR